MACFIKFDFVFQVHVRIKIPTRLGGEERKLIEELRDMNEKGRAKAGRWGFGGNSS